MTQSRQRNIPIKRKDKITFWSAAVRAWEKSGLTQREFCQNQGLGTSTFRYWKKELATAKKNKIQQQELIPVAISISDASSGQTNSSSLISLTASGRYRIDIHDGFHPETLEQVLRILERIS
jgi:hypothetical protein